MIFLLDLKLVYLSPPCLALPCLALLCLALQLFPFPSTTTITITTTTTYHHTSQTLATHPEAIISVHFTTTITSFFPVHPAWSYLLRFLFRAIFGRLWEWKIKNMFITWTDLTWLRFVSMRRNLFYFFPLKPADCNGGNCFNLRTFIEAATCLELSK